jgi:hypothetical protein
VEFFIIPANRHFKPPPTHYVLIPTNRHSFLSAINQVSCHKSISKINCEFLILTLSCDRLCGLVVSVADYKHRGPGFESRALLKIFLRELRLERGLLSLVIG